MQDEHISSSKSNQLDQAYEWLKAAKRDYKAYAKEVRAFGFLPFMKIIPNEPQTAINHLSQCVEKLVKSIAIASGEYDYDELVRDFGHDSLSLYLDIIQKMLNTPIAGLFFNSMEGKIFKQADAELFSQAESIRRITEIQDKAELRPAHKEMKEWAFEYATLPKDHINVLVKSQRKSLLKAKRAAFIIRRIPMKSLMKIGTTSSVTYSGILSYFEKRGFLLSENLKGFFKHEDVASKINSVSEEKKLLFINHLGDLLVTGILFTSLLILTALTYTHAISPKYPSKPENVASGKHILGSESYKKSLGLSGSLINVGNLTSCVLNEVNKQLPSFTDLLALLKMAIDETEDR